MCPSDTTHGLLHRLAIHLDPAALGSPSFHLAFESRILLREPEQSLSSDRAAEDLTALVLVVFTTTILAGLDEDPDAVLADGRTTTCSTAFPFVAALDADSTNINVIASLDSVAATHETQGGVEEESEQSIDDVDESLDDTSSSSVSASSSTSSSCSDSHSDSRVDSSDRPNAQSIAKVRRAMSLDWEYLESLEYGDTPVPIQSLHTVRLLASIARQEVDHLDTLPEDERDAGSEVSGLESLHMSSDESDTEERVERRRESNSELASFSIFFSLPFSFHALLQRVIWHTSICLYRWTLFLPTL